MWIFPLAKICFTFTTYFLNKAIEKATQVNESELGALAKEGMPNIPGMDSFFK